MLRVRKVEPGDRELLEAAARADTYHLAAGLKAEHWMDESESTLWWEDENGPVVALKTTNVVRADIQFLTQDFERNGKALLDGFWRYADILQKRGVKEIIFNTESPQVAKFFAKRFHFKQLSKGTYSLRIA